MASINLTEPHQESDSDEWEYEYDPNETEEIYVTVDLTSHVQAKDRRQFPERRAPPVINRQSLNASKRLRKAKHKKVDSAVASGDPEATSGQSDNNDTEFENASSPPNGNLSQSQEENPTPEDGPSEDFNRLQILDLAGKNPIVSIAGKVYSCEWALSLGTDMLFEAPATRHFSNSHLQTQAYSAVKGTVSQVEEASHAAEDPSDAQPASTTKPSQEIPPANLLGTTHYRLIAHPVTLLQRKPEKPDYATAHADNVRKRRKAQEDFLDRLSTVRRSKGLNDWVPRNYGELERTQLVRPGEEGKEPNDESSDEYQGDGGWGAFKTPLLGRGALKQPNRGGRRGRGSRGGGMGRGRTVIEASDGGWGSLSKGSRGRGKGRHKARFPGVGRGGANFGELSRGRRTPTAKRVTFDLTTHGSEEEVQQTAARAEEERPRVIDDEMDIDE